MPESAKLDERVDDHGYAQCDGGKWHWTIDPEPTFLRVEQSFCGLKFRPLNVSWRGEWPPGWPRRLTECSRCTSTTAARH